MNRKELLILALLLNCLLRPIHAQSSSDPLPVEKVLEEISIAHWGQERILIYLPLYVALDGGFFAAEGLTVRLKYSGNDDQVFAAVISGSAQFGVGDPTFTAISRQRGGPGKVVAALVSGIANWGVARDPLIKEIISPNQLSGLRISSFPSPSTTFTILSEIKKKYKLSKMQINEMAFGTELAALERGEVDIAIMLEPQTSIAVSKGYHVVWSIAKYYGDFALTGVTTTDEIITERPQLVQKVVNALQRAFEYIRENPKRSTAIVAKSFPTLAHNIVENAINRMTNDITIPISVRLSDAGWRKTLSMRVEVGDLESVEIGMKAVDNSFADKALLNPKAENIASIKKSYSPRKAKKLNTISGYWKWNDYIAVISDMLSIIIVFFGIYIFIRNKHQTFELDADRQAEARDLLKNLFNNKLTYSELLNSLIKNGYTDDRAKKAIKFFINKRLIYSFGEKTNPMISLAMPNIIDRVLGNDNRPKIRRYID